MDPMKRQKKVTAFVVGAGVLLVCASRLFVNSPTGATKLTFPLSSPTNGWYGQMLHTGYQSLKTESIEGRACLTSSSPWIIDQSKSPPGPIEDAQFLVHIRLGATSPTLSRIWRKVDQIAHIPSRSAKLDLNGGNLSMDINLSELDLKGASLNMFLFGISPTSKATLYALRTELQVPSSGWHRISIRPPSSSDSWTRMNSIINPPFKETIPSAAVLLASGEAMIGLMLSNVKARRPTPNGGFTFKIEDAPSGKIAISRAEITGTYR